MANAENADVEERLFPLLPRVVHKGRCLALPDALGEIPQPRRKRLCKPNVEVIPEKKYSVVKVRWFTLKAVLGGSSQISP